MHLLEVANTQLACRILPAANTQRRRLQTQRRRTVVVAGTTNPRLHRFLLHPTRERIERAMKENRLRKGALTCIARDSGILSLCAMHFQTLLARVGRVGLLAVTKSSHVECVYICTIECIMLRHVVLYLYKGVELYARRNCAVLFPNE